MRCSNRILVILGHPRSDSFCGALAQAYVEGARASGVAVDYLRLGELKFDPDVRHLSPRSQALEPDLEKALAAIQAAQHLVFVFPTWWATMPAVLKGFLDRVLVPGVTFDVDEKSPTGYVPLLKGRSAHVITTMDSPAWVYRFIYRSPGLRAMKGGILGFCGIRPVTDTLIPRVKHLTDLEKVTWIGQTRQLGENAKDLLQKREKRRNLLPWLQVMRLQFYAMTLLSYGLGATAVVLWTDISFSWPTFVVGFGCLFFLEMATVFFNEYYDQKTDQLNRNGSPFNGGSRVLVEEKLPAARVHRAATYTLMVAGVFALLLLLLNSDFPWLREGIPLLALGALLGPGYTVPPLQLVYRGLGELTVAFTHSTYMILCGWVFLGGSIADPLPWLLGLPMFFAIFTSITLAGVPDRDADREAGKKTLPVRITNRGAAFVAMASAVAALFATTLIMIGNGVLSKAFAGLLMPIAIHSALLLIVLARYLKRGSLCERIDFLLVLALLFSLWFSVGPLVNLLK